MGADLVTYFCYGPRKLKTDETTLAEARKKAQATIAAARQAFDTGNWEDAGLSHLDSGADECELRDILDTNVDSAIENLIAIWNKAHARDVSWRFVPEQGDNDLIGLVAGGMSWGDEPEGLGYQTLKVAHLLGLFPVFGIQ